MIEDIIMLLKDAIRRNKIRNERYYRAGKVLHYIRLHIFDYEDMGKLDKANKVIATCERILAPLWNCRNEISINKKMAGN